MAAVNDGPGTRSNTSFKTRLWEFVTGFNKGNLA